MEDGFTRDPGSEWIRPLGSTLTRMEYEEICVRVEKGAKFMSGKWGDPAYKKEQDLFTGLTNQMLEYEIEHDLLPI